MHHRDPNRLERAVHYVIDKAGNQDLGKTKLNKILWFADCAAYNMRGETVTGLLHYVKLQYGPVPPNIDMAIMMLRGSGKIETHHQYIGTYVRHGFNSLQPCGCDNTLSSDDCKSLDEVIEAVLPMTAFDVSELSHDALWEETPFGGKISVKAACAQPVPPDERILAWYKSQAR